MLTFKIDIDGVLRDILTPMCKLYNKEFKENLSPKDIKEYDVSKSFPLLSDMAYSFFFEVFNNYVFLNGAKPKKGAKEVLETLKEKGHHIAIVTNQIGLENKTLALKFLEKYNIPYDSIHFTNKKWMVEGDVLVDDNLKFIKEEIKFNPDTTCVIVDYPYNREAIKHRNTTNTIRINNLTELLKIS